MLNHSLNKKNQALNIKNNAIADRHSIAIQLKIDKGIFCGCRVEMLDNYW